MRFTVVWDRTAEAERAAAWLAAADKSALSAAVYVLEQRLQVNPADEGESRPGGIRIAHERPVGLNFQVLAGGTVRVVRFWTFR